MEKGIRTAKELAKQLAPRSTILRDFFVEKLLDPEKKDTLHELFDAFKQRVFKDFHEVEFANVFAQMISYGLFLARLQTDGTVTLTVDNAKNYIPKNFDLIKQLSRFFEELHTKPYESIRWIVDELFLIINTFDFESVHESLMFDKNNGNNFEKQPNKDPYIYFYEDFLSEFDGQLRKDLGVYYTPLPIVRYIIQGVDEILKTELGIAKGFADGRVTALDFATGTGTFLVEMFKHVLDTLPEDSGKRDFIIQNHLLNNFYGFEYMIAPYVIAHLKLSEFLKEKGYKFNDDERLKIYLANTLEPSERTHPEFSLPYLNSLDNESKAAQETKKKPILVIVGNPPYNSVSRHHTPGLIDAYKMVDGQPLNEKKIWLNDDYVKFIRFAQNKMDQVEEGVVGIITNHGFLDNPTFRGMRQSLMNSFQQIYTLNLHGNVKKREICPNGSKDENIFDIQQGVCITFFIKKNVSNPGVYYADLWGTREEKFNYCWNQLFSTTSWKKLDPTSKHYYFVPFDSEFGEEYTSFNSLKDIFQSSSVGIVTSRDSLTIDFDKNTLKERVRDFAFLPTEEAREKYKLGKDSRDWKVHLAQKCLKDSGLSSDNIHDIHYRPFDVRKIYYTPQSKGFVSQPLYNIMQHMLAGENVGLVFVRQRKSSGWQHSFVSNQLIESCYISSKTGEMNYIAPLYLYPPSSYLNGLTLNLEKQENFNPIFREWINDYYSWTYSPEKILGYIYAILYCPSYRLKYCALLQKDFPRIPFVKDRQLFEKLSDIGNILIQSHLMKEIPALDLGRYFGQGENDVDKILYDIPNKKLFINSNQYFSGVSPEVWHFEIGGYRVLDKYLKSRKKRTLKFEEIENIENIVNILTFTIEQVKKIDGIYQAVNQENWC